MSQRPTTRSLPWLQAMGVVFLTFMVAGLIFQRFTWTDWTRPQWLEGDPLEVYLRVKIAGEQPAHALLQFKSIDRLGAPAAADWSAYPVPDRLVFVLTGLIARAVGLAAAVNGVSALILGLNAASFFLCARFLRCRREWALATALVFALGNYGLRWGITLSFSQVFVLPPLVLLCARAARRGPAVDAMRPWVILAVCLGGWLGMANPYLAFFAGVVGGGALVLALARRSPSGRLRPLLVFLGCLTASFLVANAAYLVPRFSGATSAALVRGAGDYAAYALQPLEWLVPPADHRIPALGRLGRAYLDARGGIGEFFYNYLGLLGLAGLAGLLVRAVRDCRRIQRPRLDPLWGLFWIVVFAMPDGINRWLAAGGLDVFRAGTRIGIYAQVWALLFIAGWLARRTRAWPGAASAGVALVLAGLAVWEQTPPFGGRRDTAPQQARWESYQNLTDALEANLPSSAMIFQLPVVPFPEAGRVGGMPDYEHALPFLTSRTLRFSYGSLRPAPSLAWARAVGRLPATEMVDALQRAGFSGLWIDRRGDPERSAALRASLAALGLPEEPALNPPADVHVFRLKPVADPKLPDFADPRFAEPWDERTPGAQPKLLALHGWYPLEHANDTTWRWAARTAALGLGHEGPPVSATLRFRLGGPAGNRVILRQDDKVVLATNPAPGEQQATIDLRAGVTTLQWELEGSTFRPGGHDGRDLGFMVENLSVSVP